MNPAVEPTLGVWLDHMGVPPAPDGIGDAASYRLGWLDHAHRAPAHAPADPSDVLKEVARHLGDVLGVELEGEPIERVNHALTLIRELAHPRFAPAVPRPSATPVQPPTPWRTRTEQPSEGAVVEVETDTGTHTGRASLEQVSGRKLLAVISDQDEAVFWPAVTRWRFA